MSELDRSVIFSDEENCVSQSSMKKPNKQKALILSESEDEGAPSTPSTEGSSMEAEPDCLAELKNNLDKNDSQTPAESKGNQTKRKS